MASNIVLNDAQATPVAHTFIPVGRDAKGVFWFEDQSQSNAIGYWKISVELKRPPAAPAGTSSDGRTARVEVGLHEPTLETLSNSTVSGILPAPTVSYVMRAFNSFAMPERGSLQNRKDLRKMSASLLDDTQIKNVIENLLYLS